MADANALERIVDDSFLRRAAGERSYERGRDYFETGAVERLGFEGEVLTATVLGGDRYRVELRPTQGSAEASCTCPHAREGAFCKHCVAAGLALIEAGGETVRRRAPATLEEIRAELKRLDRDSLVALLVAEARVDERVLDRLRLHFASGADALDLAAFQRAIESAVDPGGGVPYREAYAWSVGVEEAIDSIEALLDLRAEAVIELSEHALGELERSYGYVDDSDGHVSVLRERLESLHLTACKRARPDPGGLAERLLRWQLESELEIFWSAPHTYDEALGDAGLERYAELARAEWEGVPELGPGEKRDRGRRFRISHVMEDLARKSGDPDDLVAVLRRDLSMPYGFLKIAQVYRDAGRLDEAIEWAERGRDAFPERPDSRLQSFLAEAHAEAGRPTEALEIAWDQFADHPGLETYRAVKPYAERVDEWPRRRERALGLLRKRAREAREEAKRRGYPLRRADHSELVRILLWEGEDDTAWNEAVEGGCTEGLWLELAERRRDDHPGDALGVYRERIEPAIARTDKAGYRQAVEYLGTVAELLAAVGRADELAPLVAEIRTHHARKRNLIKLLDEARFDVAAGKA